MTLPARVESIRHSADCKPQSFLQHGGSLEDLKSGYAIGHRRGIEFPNLVTLKYNQIDSPMGDPLVQQCRGLILDEADNWRVIARPFDKFFNYGESYAANLDWRTAVVTEKLDGTLCILYYWRGDWHVATSGTPDAMGEVHGGLPMTYKDLFWSVWNTEKYLKPRETWKDQTFMFELTTPFNRVVVKQPGQRLTLIGVRDRTNGEQIMPDEWPCKPYNWREVKMFKMRSMKDIIASFDTMDPLDQEGYVVVDAWYDRLKVKHPGYVALHHMRGDGFGPRRIVECIRAGEVNEILASFAEWTPEFTKYQHLYADLLGHIESEWERLKDIPGGVENPIAEPELRREFQKTFAEEALRGRCSSALFALRKGQFRTAKEFVKSMHIDTLLILLETQA